MEVNVTAVSLTVLSLILIFSADIKVEKELTFKKLVAQMFFSTLLGKTLSWKIFHGEK